MPPRDRSFGLLNGGLNTGDHGGVFKVAGVERLSGRWQRGADGGGLQPFEKEANSLLSTMKRVGMRDNRSTGRSHY
ncbi:hypothetical protein [Sphaerothrix gracilis]|uniref:hypothetical protein n=1 Tax=Sphaerothrix gracilis TaxID=3151835 RepID=UPI0031FC8E2D